jgi:hypothetical protein
VLLAATDIAGNPFEGPLVKSFTVEKTAELFMPFVISE